MIYFITSVIVKWCQGCVGLRIRSLLWFTSRLQLDWPWYWSQSWLIHRGTLWLVDYCWILASGFLWPWLLFVNKAVVSFPYLLPDWMFSCLHPPVFITAVLSLSYYMDIVVTLISITWWNSLIFHYYVCFSYRFIFPHHQTRLAFSWPAWRESQNTSRVKMPLFGGVCIVVFVLLCYVSVAQVASFWWTKGGPVDSWGGAVANGETTAAATASSPAASYINVVRG